jgi:hypothetical protein
MRHIAVRGGWVASSQFGTLNTDGMTLLKR